MPHHEVKLGIFGAAAAGKSALTLQFVNKVFPEEYDETVEDLYRCEFKMGDSEFVVNITDTAGVDELAEKRDEHIKGCNAFLVVYDMTSAASFEEAKKYYAKICGIHEGMQAFALIANKSDKDTERAVSAADGRALAQSWGNHVPYLEASAKTFDNVQESFHAVMTSFVYALTGEGLDFGDDEPPPPPPGEDGAPPPPPDAADDGNTKEKAPAAAKKEKTTGWLTKKPRNLGRTKTRWFVLDPTKDPATLSFYAEKGDDKAIRTLVMTNVTFYPMPEPLMFKLDGPGMDVKSKEPMTLTAQNAKEFEKWKNAIEAASTATKK
eukprot:TRINITY_DN62221_c0_g2_i1.p1 TRINITY_DN62221_c0_g2~~TRINITY_DN62221_c0_g2_i1.p1  ORF type:complete len:336 (+),score=43.02 TRINITY_DN62221_c0_g2_i1:44-1009(+)